MILGETGGILLEWLEDPIQVSNLDADARINNGEPQPFFFWCIIIWFNNGLFRSDVGLANIN